MKKNIRYCFVLIVLVLISIIGILCFVQQFCFFPSMKTDQICWYLSENGDFTGVTPNSNHVFDETNPSNIFTFRHRSLPISLKTSINRIEQLNYFVPENMYSGCYCIEVLDSSSGEKLSCEDFELNLKEDEHANLLWCVPPDLIVFKKQEKNRRLSEFSQPSHGAYEKQGTQVIFNFRSETSSQSKWTRVDFDYYQPNDVYLLCWEHSDIHHGCFFLFEVYSKQCNQLVYYDYLTRKVSAATTIHGYRNGFQCFKTIDNQTHLVTYGNNTIEIYSLPELSLIKKVTFQDLELDYIYPIAVSQDLRFFAYGNHLVHIIDMDAKSLSILDKFHHDKINMSRFYYEEPYTFSVYHANAAYDMQQLFFLPEKDAILAGINRRGEYFEWDVVDKKRISYRNLVNQY